MAVIAYKFLAPNGGYLYVSAGDKQTVDYWSARCKLIPLNDDKARAVALLNSGSGSNTRAPQAAKA
jgi:hypothetical protein